MLYSYHTNVDPEKLTYFLKSFFNKSELSQGFKFYNVLILKKFCSYGAKKSTEKEKT